MSEKKPEESFDEFVKRWTGEVIVSLGQGDFRTTMYQAMIWACDRGYKQAQEDAKKSRKSKEEK